MSAVLSEEYGTAAMKKLVFLSGINGARIVERIWEMLKEAVIQKCTDLKKCWKSTESYFARQGHSNRQAYCVEVLVRLHEAVHRKGPELWPNNWLFLHDSSRSLSTLCQAVCGKKRYWTGTAPFFTRLDLWLSPNWSPLPRDENFRTVKTLKKKVMAVLKVIPKGEHINIHQEWQHCWD